MRLFVYIGVLLLSLCGTLDTESSTSDISLNEIKCFHPEVIPIIINGAIYCSCPKPQEWQILVMR